LIKASIPDQLLADWFTKSLLPQIARDVAMGGVVTEEQAIARAQYMDLVYSQSGTLYDIIPQASRASNDTPSVTPSAKTGSVDGVIGSVSKQKSGKQSNVQKSMSNLTLQDSDSPSDKAVSEVNTVQSSGSNKSSAGDQKKGKTKKKSNNNTRFGKKSNDASDRKPKYPCIICGEMHFTKDCPHRENVQHFVKGNPPTTAVLTDPFPDQANQVESHNQTSDSSSSQVLMCQEEVRISTRTTDYSQKEGSSSKQPVTESTPPTNNPLQIERPNT
jgi:hypothetical protein